MKVKTVELSAILKDLRSGLANKPLIPWQTHFLFTGDHLVTFNDKVCIGSPFKTDFKCTVEAELFAQIISGIEEEELELSAKETVLVIKSESTDKSKATDCSVCSGPVSEDVLQSIARATDVWPKAKWKPLPNNFNEGLDMISFSVGHEAVDNILSGLYVDKNFLCSTDQLRISRFTLTEPMSETFSIPLAVLSDMSGFKLTHYYKDQNKKDTWVHFKTKDWLNFSILMLSQGDFPNIDDKKFDVRGARLPIPKEFQSKLKAIVDSVSILAVGECEAFKQIDIHVEPGRISCQAEQIGKGKIKKTMDFSVYKGKAFSFTVNPIFLSQVIDKAPVIIIEEENAVIPRALFKFKNFEHVMSLPAET